MGGSLWPLRFGTPMDMVWRDKPTQTGRRTGVPVGGTAVRRSREYQSGAVLGVNGIQGAAPARDHQRRDVPAASGRHDAERARAFGRSEQVVRRVFRRQCRRRGRGEFEPQRVHGLHPDRVVSDGSRGLNCRRALPNRGPQRRSVRPAISAARSVCGAMQVGRRR